MFTALFVLYGKKRLPVRESTSKKLGKIIHVDMDYFYVAIEIRDNPEVREKLVTVGGLLIRGASFIRLTISLGNMVSNRLSLLPYAKKFYPSLIILPVNMEKIPCYWPPNPRFISGVYPPCRAPFVRRSLLRCFRL